MTDDQPIPSAPQSSGDASNNTAHANSNAIPEVKIPPSHTCYRITCDKKRDKWDIAKLVAEFTGLGFLILYTLYTAGIYCANQRSADAAQAANRPYVGVEGVDTSYVDKDAKKDGTAIVTATQTKTSNQFLFHARVKNYGPVPGTNFNVGWKVWLGGDEQKITGIPHAPQTIYPTEDVILSGKIGTADFPALMRGDKILVLKVTVVYDGPGGTYTECDTQQFAPANNGFLNLGKCSE
jgi:hypothetical protein